MVVADQSPIVINDGIADNNNNNNSSNNNISSSNKQQSSANPNTTANTNTKPRFTRFIATCFLLSLTWHCSNGIRARKALNNEADRRKQTRNHRGLRTNMNDGGNTNTNVNAIGYEDGIIRSLLNKDQERDQLNNQPRQQEDHDRPWPVFSRKRHSDAANTKIADGNGRYYKSIFYQAFKSLYKTTNSYSQLLSDTQQQQQQQQQQRKLVDETESEHAPTKTESEQTIQDQEDLAHELSIEVSYEDTYDILVFLGCSYVFGEIAFHLGIPPLVGQIIAGFLLGPPLADYVPFPEAMVLLGDLGLILLLVEAGIELDVGLVKEAGVRPVLIAIVGSILPFGMGMGLALAQGRSVKSAIACGACFSPTSLGVAANALSGGKALNTPVGQLIVASAVIDDMIGLIILSMLEVLVAEDPSLYEYFIPIISAVGYLIVLGLSAITWIPYVVEKKILPRFSPDNRPYVAFALLWLLVMAYLPMMYYSRASHLTGAFLAGLSFSQVEGVHHTFVSEAGAIMEWLLRIFFSASIGFQVPIKMFGNSRVVKWGLAFYSAVLGKLPVGLFAPKYKEAMPKDYPFNPFVRDVIITSAAMTCRGEFSFIIAAFGIGEALLDAELYSSIIFAVLLSSITSPILLTLILKRYNRLASKYLEQDQLDKSGVGGRAPLHINIQIRSSVSPGMQGSIKRCINSLGLFVIDQRSWHPRGKGVIVATELYAVDSKTMVDVGKSLKRVSFMEPSSPSHEKEEKGESPHVSFDVKPTIPEDEPVVQKEPDYIALRCEEIRQALLSCDDLVDANVKVLQWVPLADAIDTHSKKNESERAIEREKSILGQVASALQNKETIDTLVDEAPEETKKKRFKMLSGPISWGHAEKQAKKEAEAEAEGVGPVSTSLPSATAPVVSIAPTVGLLEEGLRRRPRRVKTVSSPSVGGADLWGEDIQAQAAAVAGAPQPPVQYDTNSGMRYGVARRQRMKSDLGAIAEAAPTIEERLGGLVRHDLSGV